MENLRIFEPLEQIKKEMEFSEALVQIKDISKYKDSLIQLMREINQISDLEQDRKTELRELITRLYSDPLVSDYLSKECLTYIKIIFRILCKYGIEKINSLLLRIESHRLL